MKTILSLDNSVSRTFIAARAPADSPPPKASVTNILASTTRSTQRFMGVVCLTAIVMVFFSICFANPVANANPTNPQGGNGNGPSREIGTIRPARKIQAAAHPEHTQPARQAGKNQPLSTLSVIPQPGTWSMISLGFVLLAAQRRIFRPMEK
jgi:hypothetical protein